jgi:SET domain-containing protein
VLLTPSLGIVSVHPTIPAFYCYLNLDFKTPTNYILSVGRKKNQQKESKMKSSRITKDQQKQLETMSERQKMINTYHRIFVTEGSKAASEYYKMKTAQVNVQ